MARPSLNHAAIPPVIVGPGQSQQIIALRPEYIMPQGGHATQDCERAGGKRWLAAHAAQVAPHGVTFLGDDLYAYNWYPVRWRQVCWSPLLRDFEAIRGRGGASEEIGETLLAKAH